MQRKLLSLLVLFLASSQPAMADQIITKYIPNAKIVGEGRLSVIFWDVYDATLYAPNGRWQKEKPFALSIHYFRQIEGADIADRSVEEMRGQGFHDEAMLAKWQAEMKEMFPDVQNGTVLTAIFVPGSHTAFFKNSQPLGTIKGDNFIHRFSSIWLSEKTSEPALRLKLLGSS